ncbi:MAG: hypothetical protein WD397_07970 [Wenzhouxiangellaceae bacterium]
MSENLHFIAPDILVLFPGRERPIRDALAAGGLYLARITISISKP